MRIPLRSPCIFALSLFVYTSAHSMAAVVLPNNLPVGSSYQLAFVTAGQFTAEQSDIGYYNELVTAQAAPLSAILPSGVTWTAIGSTNSVNAKFNAPNPGLPVYNTAGEEVTTASSGLYGGTFLDPIEFDQFGSVNNTEVWTGTYAGGTSDPIWCLGGSKTISQIGFSSATDWGWLNPEVGDRDTYSTLHSLYALSSPITVSPEPSPCVLLLFAAVPFVLRRPRPPLY